MMARMGMVTDDPLYSREASEASDVISKQGREQPVAFFQLSLWSPLQHLFIKVNFHDFVAIIFYYLNVS